MKKEIVCKVCRALLAPILPNKYSVLGRQDTDMETLRNRIGSDCVMFWGEVTAEADGTCSVIDMGMSLDGADPWVLMALFKQSCINLQGDDTQFALNDDLEREIVKVVNSRQDLPKQYKIKN